MSISLNKFKSITIRIPETDPVYAELEEMTKDGEAWSSATLALLRTKVGVQLQSEDYRHLSQQYHREMNAASDLSEKVQELKSASSALESALKAEKESSESWKHLCVALMKFLGAKI